MDEPQVPLARWQVEKIKEVNKSTTEGWPDGMSRFEKWIQDRFPRALGEVCVCVCVCVCVVGVFLKHLKPSSAAKGTEAFREVRSIGTVLCSFYIV